MSVEEDARRHTAIAPDPAEIKRAEAKRDEARRLFDATKPGDPERLELSEALMDASDELVLLDPSQAELSEEEQDQIIGELEELTDPGRRMRIVLLNRKFFAPIDLEFERALRFGRRQSHWLIDLRDVKTGEVHRKVDLGRTSDLRLAKVRDAIFEATGRTILHAEGKDWSLFREWLHALADVEESGGGEQLTREWLASFMADRSIDVDVKNKEALADALDDKVECFQGSDGCTYVRRDAIVNFVTMRFGRTTADDIALRLRVLGFHRQQVAARVGDKTSKCRYFVSPRGFDADD